jgi:hypothetical protein
MDEVALAVQQAVHRIREVAADVDSSTTHWDST